MIYYYGNVYEQKRNQRVRGFLIALDSLYAESPSEADKIAQSELDEIAAKRSWHGVEWKAGNATRIDVSTFTAGQAFETEDGYTFYLQADGRLTDAKEGTYDLEYADMDSFMDWQGSVEVR